MIALIVTFVCGVGMIAFFGNGETLPGIVCIGLIVLAWILHAESVRDARAYVNRRDYWAEGGPERKRR